MRCLLAGVLVCAAADACRAEEGMKQAGMTILEADKALGKYAAGQIYCDGTGGGVAFYSRTGWLGGKQYWAVYFEPGGRVTDIRTEYHPFAASPWLDRAVGGFGPWPAP